MGGAYQIDQKISGIETDANGKAAEHIVLTLCEVGEWIRESKLQSLTAYKKRV